MDNNTRAVTLEKTWVLRLNTILTALAFSIPFFISGPQLLTGSIVNTLLFIASAKQISRKNLYLISLLPSLGAVSNGLLFGRFTPYLLFFVPFIWLGNMVLIISFNKVRLSTVFPFSIIIPSAVKAAILYTSALIFVGNHFVPSIFISSMGAVQLFTALIGGTIASFLFKIAKRKT